MIKREYEILAQFVKAPWKKLTFSEAKKLSGKRSDSYVYSTLKAFANNGILKEEKAGNVVLYSLDLQSLKAQTYAGFIAEYMAWQQSHIPYKDLENITKKIPTEFYIMAITGSYASKKQKKGSDIDLVIITDDAIEPKKIYAELKHDSEMNIPKIHLFVFKKSEFLSMLAEKKANFGKEITKNNLILSGGQNYYKIICEAIQNGFNG